MQIEALKGNKLKKDLGAERAIKRYYNENKRGGNFGFTIVIDGSWYTLDGDHNRSGKVTSLRMGTYGHGGIYTEAPLDYRQLIQKFKAMVERTKAYGER